jgi:hypothetical protein
VAFAVDADVLQPLRRGGGQPQRPRLAGVAHDVTPRACQRAALSSLGAGMPL